MVEAVLTGAVWLFDIIAYVGMVVMLLLAWGTWYGVRTGQIAWTHSHERGCLKLAILFTVLLSWSAWCLSTFPSVGNAFVLVTNGMTSWYFGRAWWKLHTDGPNNGRRRRRAKYALKRLRGRLVAGPAPTPIRG